MHPDWVVLTMLVQNHAENPGQLPSANVTHCTGNVLQQNQPANNHKFSISINCLTSTVCFNVVHLKLKCSISTDNKIQMLAFCMIMAALWNRAGHYIFALWFLLSFFLSIFFSKKSPSGHHRTTLSGYIFATKACVENRKKLVKQQYLLYMSSRYGELQHTSG